MAIESKLLKFWMLDVPNWDACVDWWIAFVMCCFKRR